MCFALLSGVIPALWEEGKGLGRQKDGKKPVSRKIKDSEVPF